MLCQIEHCFRYARKFGRTLALDTMRSGMRDDFLKYFTFVKASPVKVVSWTEIDQEVKSGKTVPATIGGRLNDYEVRLDAKSRGFDTETGTQLCFNIDMDHDADILVHERGGGGINSYWLLQYLVPTDLLINALQTGLARLPDRYVALHIRNTDLQTDHSRLLSNLDWALRNRQVFVATDSGALQAELRKTPPPGVKFHFLASLDGASSERLHESDKTDQNANLAMLTDLFALALAERLYFAFTTAGRVSGFSGLAFGLSNSVLASRAAKLVGRKQNKGLRLPILSGPWPRFLWSQAPLMLAKLALTTAIAFRERGASS